MSQNTNTLGRLNEVLFAELERLDALDVADEAALKAEMQRSQAVQGVAREINSSAATILKSAQFRAEWAGAKTAKMPKLLEE